MQEERKKNARSEEGLAHGDADKQLPQDLLAQDEPLRFAEEEPAKGKHPFLKGLFICLPLLVLFYFGFLQKDEHTMNVRQLAKPSLRDAERINLETSPAYRDKLEAYSSQKALEARDGGQSFVAPMSEGAKGASAERSKPKEKPSPTRTLEEKPKARAEERRPHERKNTAPTQQRRHNSERRERMRAALSLLLAPTSPAPQAFYAGKEPEKRTALQKEVSKEHAVQKSSPLTAGSLLHAVSLLTISSDAPGPVVCELIDGPFPGAKILGSFTQNENGLTITFTTLLTKNGEKNALLAYAVDPKTDATSLASSIDHHYFERFGALIAASFLEGFGEAVRQSGQTAYSSVYGSGVSHPRYNLEEEVLIAAGKVGSHTASILQQNINRKPTITLESGTDIGVLILSSEPQEKTSRP